MSKFPEGLVERTVASLGIEILERKGDEIVAACPGHESRTGRADRNPSWSINEDTGLHYCFSCHLSGNLHTLVTQMVGRERAEKFLDAHLDSLPAIKQEIFQHRQIALPRPPEPRRPVPESMLAMYDPPPDWALEARRLSRRSVQRFGVLWDTSLDAWVLPLRDSVTAYLIGYQVKHERERRMINQPAGMDKSSTLFGITQAEDVDELVLVESPLDAVLLDDLDIPAVALCGSRLSAHQANILSAYKCVVLGLDNDDAGRRETERIIKAGPGFRFRRTKYSGREKDFGEMKFSDIKKALGRGK